MRTSLFRYLVYLLYFVFPNILVCLVMHAYAAKKHALIFQYDYYLLENFSHNTDTILFC
jgi:hypothetical protein